MVILKLLGALNFLSLSHSTRCHVFCSHFAGSFSLYLLHQTWRFWSRLRLRLRLGIKETREIDKQPADSLKVTRVSQHRFSTSRIQISLQLPPRRLLGFTLIYHCCAQHWSLRTCRPPRPAKSKRVNIDAHPMALMATRFAWCNQ